MTLEFLAAKARGGDRAALEEMLRGLQDRLYRLALRYLGSPAPAADATQEILVLVATQLSAYRGESAVATWAYRIAVRHLAREKRRARRWTFEALGADLGQPAAPIDGAALALADERVLENEIFVGCTQAMLQALDEPQRLAFVLGAICQVGPEEAAAILGVSEPAYRKRLSRARARLDAFVRARCGVADIRNPCRCRNQVNLNLRRRTLDPHHLRYATPLVGADPTAVEALAQAHAVRDAVELFRAQPELAAPDGLVPRVRALLEGSTRLLGGSGGGRR